MPKEREINKLLTSVFIGRPIDNTEDETMYTGCLDYRAKILETEIGDLFGEMKKLNDVITELDAYLEAAISAVNINLEKKEERYQSDPSDKMNEVQDELENLRDLIETIFSDKIMSSVEAFYEAANIIKDTIIYIDGL